MLRFFLTFPQVCYHASFFWFFSFFKEVFKFSSKRFLLLVIFPLRVFSHWAFPWSGVFTNFPRAYLLLLGIYVRMFITMYVSCTYVKADIKRNAVNQARRLSRFRDGRSSSPPGPSTPPPTHTLHSAPWQLSDGVAPGGRADGLTWLTWLTAEVISHGGVSESDKNGSLIRSRLTRLANISTEDLDDAWWSALLDILLNPVL